MAVVLVFVSCVGTNIRKDLLDIKITPEKGIRAGTIVTVEVKAEIAMKKVEAYLDVFFGVKVPLKYNKKKKIWIYKNMVPYGMVVPKGDYLVKVEAWTKLGERITAEKKVSVN